MCKTETISFTSTVETWLGHGRVACRRRKPSPRSVACVGLVYAEMFSTALQRMQPVGSRSVQLKVRPASCRQAVNGDRPLLAGRSRPRRQFAQPHGRRQRDARDRPRAVGHHFSDEAMRVTAQLLKAAEKRTLADRPYVELHIRPNWRRPGAESPFVGHSCRISHHWPTMRAPLSTCRTSKKAQAGVVPECTAPEANAIRAAGARS